MSQTEQASEWVRGGVRLLDAEPGLGETLTADERDEVRHQAVLPCVALETGPWRPHSLDDSERIQGEIRGLLVVTGLMTINVSLAGRTCTRLVAPGDLVLLDGNDLATLPVWWGWSVVETARLAVFDDRLLTIARRWPKLMGAILTRAAAQTKQALFQQAISQLPRVEDRLLALLWSVADRRGIVRPDGVWVRLPVTHDALAEMIGARRPTVSLGLRSLTEQGLVRAERDGWVLDRASVVELTAPPDETGADDLPADSARYGSTH